MRYCPRSGQRHLYARTPRGQAMERLGSRQLSGTGSACFGKKLFSSLSQQEQKFLVFSEQQQRLLHKVQGNGAAKILLQLLQDDGLRSRTCRQVEQTQNCFGSGILCLQVKAVSIRTRFPQLFAMRERDAANLGLFDEIPLQYFGDKWEDFSICDCIQGETKDLRSLIKANHILERKAHKITALKEELGQLQAELHFLSSNVKNITRQAVSEVLASYTSKGITTWSIEKILKKLMAKLDEDDVQMADYALKSAGIISSARIVYSRTTRSYRHEGGHYFWKSFPILPFVKSPEVILQPNRSPGMCWSFPGTQGEVVVKLAMLILPTAITVDHISKNLSPTGEISSAPKDFTIYGLKDENEENGIFLGQFVYNAEGDIVQTFKLKGAPSERMSYINYVKLKVLSNWGHPNYTCIYRFRVHDSEKI
uniref:SUN domain-containing protein 3 n=1 Tax=Euleptes europaea TaxID=460621 RepID=UPI00253FC431|nr:SUN domain-containing protein 3 [Euleptes europaea]